MPKMNVKNVPKKLKPYMEIVKKVRESKEYGKLPYQEQLAIASKIYHKK